MQNDLSYIELRIIQKLALKRPFEDIAVLVDKPLEVIAEVIAAMFKNKKETPLQYMLDEKAKKLQERRRRKQEKKLKKIRLKQEKPVRRDVEHKKQRLPVYADRNINFRELISVRIDNKTVIQVKPGEDIESVKEAYKKRLEASRNYNKERLKETVPVKKFKPM